MLARLKSNCERPPSALRDELVARDVCQRPGLLTQRPARLRLHQLQGHLGEDAARGLDVDALVLHAHHDDPPEGLGGDGQRQREID